jgi:hypothetical protein
LVTCGSPPSAGQRNSGNETSRCALRRTLLAPCISRPSWCRLFWHWAARARSRARITAGNKRDSSTEIIAKPTSSSINDKPARDASARPDVCERACIRATRFDVRGSIRLCRAKPDGKPAPAILRHRFGSNQLGFEPPRHPRFCFLEVATGRTKSAPIWPTGPIPPVYDSAPESEQGNGSRFGTPCTPSTPPPPGCFRFEAYADSGTRSRHCGSV